MLPRSPRKLMPAQLLLAVLVAVLSIFISADHVLGQESESLVRTYRERIVEAKRKLDEIDEPARGVPFPRVPGPQCLEDRIAIVGGGFAGIDMAVRLKRKGFKNVTILEKTNRVGGKSIHVEHRGVINALATYIVTPDSPLLDYDDLDHTRMANIRSFSNYSINATQTTFVQDLVDFGINHLNTKDKHSAIDAVFDALNRYIEIHAKLFGTGHEYELVRRPVGDDVIPELYGSLGKFIMRHKLEALAPVFSALLTSRGYGSVARDVPAIYGLLFRPPKLLVAALSEEESVLNNGGFQKVLHNLIKKEKLDIRFGYEVQYVKRIEPDPLPSYEEPAYHSYQEKKGFKIFHDNGQVDEFDFVVWAAPIADLVRQSNAVPPEHRSLFKSQVNRPVATSLALVEGETSASVPIVFFPEALQTLDMDLSLLLDSYGTYQNIPGPEYAERDYEAADGGRPVERAYTMLFYGSKRQASEKEIRNKIEKTFYQGFNASRVDVPVVYFIDYFWRWRGTNPLNHWDLFDLQGQFGMWFIGSSVSFENVKSVLEYNILLMDHAEPYQECGVKLTYKVNHNSVYEAPEALNFPSYAPPKHSKVPSYEHYSNEIPSPTYPSPTYPTPTAYPTPTYPPQTYSTFAPTYAAPLPAYGPPAKPSYEAPKKPSYEPPKATYEHSKPSYHPKPTYLPPKASYEPTHKPTFQPYTTPTPVYTTSPPLYKLIYPTTKDPHYKTLPELAYGRFANPLYHDQQQQYEKKVKK